MIPYNIVLDSIWYLLPFETQVIFISSSIDFWIDIIGINSLDATLLCRCRHLGFTKDIDLSVITRYHDYPYSLEFSYTDLQVLNNIYTGSLATARPNDLQYILHHYRERQCIQGIIYSSNNNSIDFMVTTNHITFYFGGNNIEVDLADIVYALDISVVTYEGRLLVLLKSGEVKDVSYAVGAQVLIRIIECPWPVLEILRARDDNIYFLGLSGQVMKVNNYHPEIVKEDIPMQFRALSDYFAITIDGNLYSGDGPEHFTVYTFLPGYYFGFLISDKAFIITSNDKYSLTNIYQYDDNLLVKSLMTVPGAPYPLVVTDQYSGFNIEIKVDDRIWKFNFHHNIWTTN